MNRATWELLRSRCESSSRRLSASRCSTVVSLSASCPSRGPRSPRAFQKPCGLRAATACFASLPFEQPVAVGVTGAEVLLESHELLVAFALGAKALAGEAGALREPRSLAASPVVLAGERRELTITLDDPFLRRRLDAGELGAQAHALRSESVDLRPTGSHLAFELRDPLVPLVVRAALRTGLTGTPRESCGLAASFVVLVGERRELAVALGESLLGRSELRPLLLELRVQDLLLGRRGRLELGRLLVRRCFGQSLEGLIGARQGADDSPSVALVALLDHRAEPRAEAGLRCELDPVLRGERVRELRAGHEAAIDERLTEPAAGPLLLCEGVLELVGSQESLFDEQAPEGPPRYAGRFHTPSIGSVATGVKGLCRPP